MLIKFQRVNTAHDQSDSIPQEVIDDERRLRNNLATSNNKTDK